MPVLARTRAERTLVGLIFSGLVRLGPNNAYEPDLAESWTTADDGTTWTFTLRDDAVWQDGEPVTADDVVYTVEALKDPVPPGAVAGAWAEVTATAVDPRTVKLEVATPIGGFLAAATQPLLPAHLLADVPFADLGTSPFATSPVAPACTQLIELDDEQAVLSRRRSLAGGGGDAGRADTIARRPCTPAPTSTPTHALPYLERLRCTSTTTRRLPPMPSRRARSTWRPGCRPPRPPRSSPTRPSTASATRRPRSRPSCSTFGRPTPSSATRGSARPCSGRWTATPSSRPRWAGRDPGGHARLAGVVGLRRQGRRPGRVRRQGGDEAAQRGRLEEEGRRLAPPRTARPVRARPATVPARPRTRGLASSPPPIAKAWTDFGIKVEVTETPAVDLAKKLRGGEFDAAALDITMGLEPDLYPLLASSQVRGSGTNLVGLPGPRLDALLETARKPGRPTRGRRRGRSCSPALAARSPCCRSLARANACCFGASRAHRRGSSRARGPVLGCASMAPRRGPVSLWAGSGSVGPRWRNGRRARFQDQWPQGRVGSSPSLGTIPSSMPSRRTPGPRWRNWYTRTFEGRMRQLIRVQVPAWAPPPS